MPDYQFPNFQVPPGTFPFDNLPQQLQRTFTAMPTASYGRWNGTGVTQGLGYPAGINPGPPMGYPQGGGLLGSGAPTPNPGGLLGGGPPAPPQPSPAPGTISAGNLPPGPGGGMPGFTPNQSPAYAQMKADTLSGSLPGDAISQRLALMRQRAAASAASGPTLAQFQQTFSSLPDAERFVYWNSLPNKAAMDPYTSSIPGFRDWVNKMFNNYAGGSLAGAKWDFANNRIMQ